MPTENRRVATYLPKDIDDRLKVFIAEHNLKGESQALITILSKFFEVSYPVARQVDYSAFVSQEQFKELLDKVSELSEAFEKSKASSAVNLLLGKMQRLESRMESLEGSEEPRRKIEPEVLPGQLDLLTDAESDLPSSSKSESLKVEQSGLPGNLESELVSETQANRVDDLPSDSSSDSSSNLLKTENTGSTLNLLKTENTGSTLEPLTGTELALRFRVHEKLPTNKRNLLKSEQGFAEWTKEQDPDGISWRYDSEAKGRKKYFPLLDGETSSQVSPLPEGSERSGEG